MTGDFDHVQLAKDTTIRWSCRSGDYVLWVRLADAFSGHFSVSDVWEMRNGDFITITNRVVDLPHWFELQPDEVQGQAVHEMMRKLKSGFKPGGAVQGPNLWRACAGDRVAWVGPHRSSRNTKGVQVLATLRENFLVFAESNRPDFSPLDLAEVAYGLESPEAQRLCRLGFEAACELGVPNEFASEWSLG